jgi:hypothetical protein
MYHGKKPAISNIAQSRVDIAVPGIDLSFATRSTTVVSYPPGYQLGSNAPQLRMIEP